MRLAAQKSAGPATYNTITRRVVKPRTLPLQLSKHSTHAWGAVIKHLVMALTRQFLHQGHGATSRVVGEVIISPSLEMKRKCYSKLSVSPWFNSIQSEYQTMLRIEMEQQSTRPPIDWIGSCGCARFARFHGQTHMNPKGRIAWLVLQGLWASLGSSTITSSGPDRSLDRNVTWEL